MEQAAALAAEESLEGLETEEEFDEESLQNHFTQSLELSTDVFEEGFKKAMALKDAPRFHIKKNSQFLTVKDYPYSWELLQKEFGPGYYHVQCKARSNGRILKSQTEMVGDPNEGRPAPEQEGKADDQQDNNLAVLGWLQQSQERAEIRAREMATKTENGFAQVMQGVMSMQQQSSQTMMQMMMEQSKQTQNLMLALFQNQQQPKGPDPMITLLSTLLTKEKPKDGMGFNEVLKLLADKERDTRTAVEKQYELIEKKADQLAEIKAEAMSSSSGEGEAEESLSKTLVKGFIPMLTQIVAQGGPAQIQQRLEEQRRLEDSTALREGFVEDHAVRPAIPAARPQPNAQNPSPRPAATPNHVATPTQAAPVTESVPKEAVHTSTAQDLVLDPRQKEAIFDFCAPDIGQAMIAGTAASKAVEDVLLKLEKEGLSRQTVATGFKLEDFYGFAEKYIPAEQMDAAKSWLKEFYEFIQKASVGSAQSARAESTRPSRNNGVRRDQAPVATGRGPVPARGTRVQPRQTAENI
ncbi:MAG: hypothetical protein HC883_00260 [Bdellovibrionaceae bacterium]|nr:hypothetical protein [Pseudobdellovibrionaceae bacterium]